MNNLVELELLENDLRVRAIVPCTHCGEVHEFLFTEEETEAFLAYQDGEGHIQTALPNMAKEDRELFVSGICGKCWTKLFGTPEDPDSPNEDEE